MWNVDVSIENWSGDIEQTIAMPFKFKKRSQRCSRIISEKKKFKSAEALEPTARK